MPSTRRYRDRLNFNNAPLQLFKMVALQLHMARTRAWAQAEIMRETLIVICFGIFGDKASARCERTT